MFRTVTFLFVVGQFLFVKSQSDITEPSIEKKIQTDIFKIINTEVRASWSSNYPHENIVLRPLSLKIGEESTIIKIYYENECYEYPKNKVLKESYTLGKIIEKLQQTTNAKLKFTNAIFYDERNTPKQYLDDIKTYYNAKTFQVSFDSSNQAEVFALVNKWLKQNVEIPSEVTAEPFNLTGVYNFQNIMTIYSSCWNIPKTLGNSIKLLKFKTPEGKINIEAFDAKETVGYYNNVEKKYQAIRLPYKNGEFAMIVVLPNKDQSLESIIGKFTENDYMEVMTCVSENHENINYAIPFLKLEGMVVNEKGVSRQAALLNTEILRPCNAALPRYELRTLV